MNEEPIALAGRHAYGKKTWVKIGCLMAGIGGPVFGAIVLLQLDFITLSLAAKAVFGGIFLLDAALILAFGFRSRLVIDGSRIAVTGVMRTKVCDRSEVEGYRSIRGRYGITPCLHLKGSGRTVSLPTDLAVDDHFRAWLSQIPELPKK